ncbi:MAG: lysophospholipid acyltransferase family protein [Proteobacteria bacterium]|nr:lysophospholipid acyltransferase family protein [Pseudomonadota bacterium]MBU1716736.1 lysophospholipid acyltransferase family protein [Pseudomonadota bacterium]
MLLLFGQAGAYLLLMPVIFSYLIFSRKIHRNVAYYMKRRFPAHGVLRLWFDTYQLVYSFGQVLVDRGWLGLCRGARLNGELVGQDELLALIAKGRGLVLLTAHVGNWQTALSHICGFKVPVNSLMHYEQEAVAKHYFDLRRESVPFKIIKSNGFMGGMIESTAALQRGEVVTIMGDRYAGGPYAEVTFLGGKVRLPAAAYSLAAATGAPVAILLAAKTRRRDYIMKVWDIFYPEPCDRNHRQEHLSRWTGRFAQSLERYLGEYPYQWYNFFDFWSQ